MAEKTKIILKARKPLQGDSPPVATPTAKRAGPAKSPPPPQAPPVAAPDDDEEVEMWDIDRLYPHPLQAVHFDHEADADFENLVEDIRINGQRDAIGILPCGAVIDGERRRRVANRLGLNPVKVVVRHKLAAAGEEAIELYLITANTARRQLSRLAQARLFLRSRELKERLGLLNGRCKLRDEFAKRLGMSGRQLDRYVAALSFPRELQNAIEKKLLPMVKAERLMKRPREEFEPVLKLLREGLSIRKEVNRLLLHVDDRTPLTETKLARMWRVWLWTAEQLTTHQEAVGEFVKRHQQDRLLMAQELAGSFLASLEQDAEDEPTDEDTEGQDDDVPQDDGQLREDDEAEYI